MDDINIGQKIMDYRKAKKLSIRELASMIDVTSSLLSQIERGLANPSINTLKLIAKALDVRLFSFFAYNENTKDYIVRAEMRKKLILPENKDVTYELLSPDLNCSIEYALMKLPPGSHSSEKLMEHNGEEAAFVMEGEVELYLNDDVFTLHTGDSVRIPPLTKHKWENPTGEHAVVIFAVTPPSF